MKQLSGSELAGFVKARQLKQVRGLVQAHHVQPRLAIVRCNPDSQVISTYIRLKQQYGADIGVDVEVHDETSTTIEAAIDHLNARDDVQAIIVQLPVVPEGLTEQVLERVDPTKDVDGLGSRALYDPATPMAVLWLLAGYNVTLEKVAIVGRGRLVGAPLASMLASSGVDVTVYDRHSTAEALATGLRQARVIITATGQPGLITADMIAPRSVVIDAGTASENGVVRGDLASDVRGRQDLTLTPEKGGLGPLTVAALFDNVLRAARRTVKKDA